MAVAETSAITDEPVPDDLVEAGVYPSAHDGFDHGLVVLALGRPFWLVPAEAGHRLLVEPAVADDVREQLAKFDRESQGWPPAPVEVDTTRRKADLFTPLLWVVALLASFWMQGAWAGWTDFGALDTQAVFDRGEIWRPLTALFLHADAGHLVSNALSGFAVIATVLTTLGRRRGWLLLAGAAIAGNFAAAALNYPGPYVSIGASTAVFAALGLLTGRAIRRALASAHPHRWRGMFVPLAAGLTVLGLFGAGGVEADVLAHATGFAAGLGLGGAVKEPTS
jgi:membrane associated rhomboid family serine protease